MAFGTQPVDHAGVPIGSPYIPGTGFAALKGSTNSNTDGSSNLSTAAAFALDQALIIATQLQNAQTGNVNGTAATINGMGSILLEIIMTGYTGTVNFEGAGPNANYDPLWAVQSGTTTVATTVTGSATTATHLWLIPMTLGLQTVRARTSSASAGNVTVNSYALPFPGGLPITSAIQNGTWTVQPGNTPNTSAWLVQTQAGTTGGSTAFHAISAASNNATSIKGSAGLVYGYTLSNTNAAARYVKLYNKATTPAPASDNALILTTIQVPASATVIGAIPEGLTFGTGIGMAAVVNMSDTDNTSVGAGDLSIDIRYK